MNSIQRCTDCSRFGNEYKLSAFLKKGIRVSPGKYRDIMLMISM